MSQLNVVEQCSFLQYLLETRAFEVALSRGVGLFVPELRTTFGDYVDWQKELPHVCWQQWRQAGLP